MMSAANGQQGAGNSQNTVTVTGAPLAPDMTTALVEAIRTFAAYIPDKVDVIVGKAAKALGIIFLVVSCGGNFVLWNKLCAMEARLISFEAGSVAALKNVDDRHRTLVQFVKENDTAILTKETRKAKPGQAGPSRAKPGQAPISSDNEELNY